MPLIENSWLSLLIIFVGGILLYFGRYDFSDTYNERKKYTELALKMMIIPSVLIIYYLFFTQSYWTLLFLILGVSYYVLDYLGLIPTSISLRKDSY